jgi:eukaryotic-like serine/threonine-protein kinase
MPEGKDRGFRLRVCAGPDAGKELLAHAPMSRPVVVGRSVSETTDLLCTDAKVSRQHATIEASGNGYVLTDHGSTNRTRVNGRLLRPDFREPLHNGDEILFGPETVVRFELLEGAQEQSAAKLPPPRYAFGAYAVYEPLYRSPKDRVDVAIDTRSGTRVALKRIAAAEIPRVVRKRLLDQAERARQWRHRNIAVLLDAGQEGEVLYVASRLIDGLTLAEIEERLSRDIEPLVSAYVIREACAAIAYAFEREPDFVHRNLRPSTIMLSYRGDVALLNFGLAPLMALSEGTGLLDRKTAVYLSPEHRAQVGLDPRSDVYSLGAILYELLTRQAIDPQHGVDFPDLRQLRPEIATDLAALTMRACDRHPEARFQNAADLYDELKAVMRGMTRDYGPPEVSRWMIEKRLGLWH